MISHVYMPFLFIQGFMVLNLGISTSDVKLAMSLLTSHTVLLRVPSGALPMSKGNADSAAAGTVQSDIFLENQDSLSQALSAKEFC